MPVKILYIEDELYLGKIVKESLESRGYEVQMYEDGKEILRKYNSFQPDLCLFDVMLPYKSGFELGKEIRHVNESIPIIYLTAKSQTSDVVTGFHSGGNDYIKKPFSMEELILRIENLRTLTNGQQESVIPDHAKRKIGQFIFDTRKMELTWNKEVKRLSHRETQLLTILCDHQGRPVDRRKILNQIWGDDHFFSSRNLDVYIRKLRGYFEKDTSVQLITLKGLGYQFVVSE